MLRPVRTVIVIALAAVVPLAAVAGTAAYGTLRRDAIKAVNACRNMATVSGQIDGLAGDLQTEARSIREGTPGRIAVVRERLEVLDGKVGELERKNAELAELASAITAAAGELQADIAGGRAAAAAGAADGG